MYSWTKKAQVSPSSMTGIEKNKVAVNVTW